MAGRGGGAAGVWWSRGRRGGSGVGGRRSVEGVGSGSPGKEEGGGLAGEEMSRRAGWWRKCRELEGGRWRKGGVEDGGLLGEQMSRRAWAGGRGSVEALGVGGSGKCGDGGLADGALAVEMSRRPWGRRDMHSIVEHSKRSRVVAHR